MAKVFHDPKFSEGGWAPELTKHVAARQFIPGFKPKSRIWRGTYHQWVQFEPDGWSGPLFWSGKPAIRATPPKAPAIPLEDDGILVGYYVERGLGEHQNAAYVMDEAWHWHGFYRCLTDPALLDELNGLMLSLSEPRRRLWVETSGSNHLLPYEGPTTLAEAKALIDAEPAGTWVGIVLGHWFSRPECLSRDEVELVGEFRTPIVRAREIYEVVRKSVASRPPDAADSTL